MAMDPQAQQVQQLISSQQCEIVRKTNAGGI
jgi:hypothetical protein